MGADAKAAGCSKGCRCQGSSGCIRGSRQQRELLAEGANAKAAEGVAYGVADDVEVKAAAGAEAVGSRGCSRQGAEAAPLRTETGMAKLMGGQWAHRAAQHANRRQKARGDIELCKRTLAPNRCCDRFGSGRRSERAVSPLLLAKSPPRAVVLRTSARRERQRRGWLWHDVRRGDGHGPPRS